MVDKGDVLRGYRLDIRDFTESQIRIIQSASFSKFTANQDLRAEVGREIRSQLHERDRYLKRIHQERWLAYRRHYNAKIYRRFGIPESAITWLHDWKKSAMNSVDKWINSADSRKWPEDKFDSASIEATHLIAGMPADCANLTGRERVKQAFFPKYFVKDFDEKNPAHVFNRNVFMRSTLVVGLTAGAGLGTLYGLQTHNQYRKMEAGKLYESSYAAVTARHHAFVSGFLKYGLRWGWRVAFLYGTIYGISQGLAIYKMEDRTSHYMLGAGVAGALYQWTTGPVGMVAGGVLGSLVIGAPIGFMFSVLHFNPRPQKYFSKAESQIAVLGKELWTQEQHLLSRQRTAAILELMNTPESPEINSIKFYRAFLGAGG